MGSLTHLLLRMGLADTSLSSRAVLNAILALSTLRVCGDQKALAYKVTATSLLRESLGRKNMTVVSIQQVVASMLLYIYEVTRLPMNVEGRPY